MAVPETAETIESVSGVAADGGPAPADGIPKLPLGQGTAARDGAVSPAIRRLREHERLLVLLSRWRINVGWILGVAAVLLMRPSPRAILVWLPLVLAGVVLRTWARGHFERLAFLSQSGPYAWIRHPLYVGSFLMGLGIAAMGRSPLLVAVFVAIYLVMYVPKAMREEAFLATTYGEPYDRYLASVSAIVPLRGRLAAGAHDTMFVWRRVWLSKEWKTWIGVVAALGVLWLQTMLW